MNSPGRGDVEGPHLRATPAAGGRDGEAHGIKNIHKREGTGGISSGPAHKRPFGAEGRELVTNSTSSFQCKASLMHRGQDPVHGVRDRPGNRTIDGAGG